MPQSSSPLQGNPHGVSIFTRLLGLYGQQSRPSASIYDEDMAREGAEYQQALSQAYSQYFQLAADRVRRYAIFDEMDSYGLISAILDVYSEESTQPDYDRRRSVWIESKNKEMIKEGEKCLTACHMEDRIASVVRRMCKYGDAYQRLVYSSGKGVLGWRMAPTSKMERVEDKYQTLKGFKQAGSKFRQGKRDTSWPWDYVHFRLLGKNDEEAYGTSLLDGMFRSWRRMTLTEESILMFRLRRVPDRNLIMVNVGSMEESAAMHYVQQWKKRMRKNEVVDPASATYRKQYNPLTPLEDVFVPLIEGRESRVEQLAGSGNIGEVYDLDHFRDEFFGAAKVPKAYFGFEGDINAKATLRQQDVRFARSCKRIQRAAVFGIRQLLDIHYTLIDGAESKFDFTRGENAYIVQMSPISYLDEFERLELMQLRYQIVEAMSRLAADMQLDPRVWATYILLNYAKLPEDLVLKLIKNTPDKVAVGGGVGFESMHPDQRKQVLDESRQQGLGYIQLSEAEQLAIAKCVHDSPGLRRSIANFTEYAAEDFDRDLLHEGDMQTDPSNLPPRETINVRDSVDETDEVKALNEDLEALRGKKK